MNELMKRETEKIEEMIYEFRGKQVMLDSDLARLYETETKRINEAVKNNPIKFPKRFSWRLTDEEYSELRSKFLTANFSNMSRTNPRVFTEQGVAMLATILKSKRAAEVSIAIMDAFVLMRHFIVEKKDIDQSLNYINHKLIEHDEKINFIFSKFDPKEQLFLPGETYDAYSKIIDIFNESKKEIMIIDRYADKTLLDFIKNIPSKIILITSDQSKLSELEINKFNRQYHKLNVVKNNTFHDRYFIIDRMKVFHIGTSLNSIGERVFSINRLEDQFVLDQLFHYVFQIIKE